MRVVGCTALVPRITDSFNLRLPILEPFRSVTRSRFYIPLLALIRCEIIYGPGASLGRF